MRHPVRTVRFWALFLTALGFLVGGLVLGFFVQGWPAWCLVAIYVGFDGWLLASSFLAARAAISEEKEPAAPPSGPKPPVSLSILVCARNERAALPATLDALGKALALALPAAQSGDETVEVLVVDDGSADGTGEWMREHFAMEAEGRTEAGSPLFGSAAWPGLRLLSRQGGGKARALNDGWQAASGELVVTLDADTLVEPGALAAVGGFDPGS
ncbi:MAG TPA: glycosyltransferase family 2 protein, partial [Candidatus Methylacidiphilales bacterium]